MNEYWKQQHDLTTNDKASFVERAREEEDSFLHSLRKVTDRAENRMLTRVACRGGEDDEDVDDASVKSVV